MHEFKFDKFGFNNIYKITYPSFGDEFRRADKLFDIKSGNIFSLLNFAPVESMVLHSKQGVLRGMHYQSYNGNRQNRLLYILSGKVFIAIVDLREDKISYGCWQGIEISYADKACIYIPGDFAIGTLAEIDSSIIMFYDKEYEQGYDRGFRFDDPKIGIKWGMSKNEMHISEKDLLLPTFQKRDK